VFAAYDYDWPPVVDWEVEAAFDEVIRRVRAGRAPDGRGMRYSKEGHLERIKASGHFRYAREIVFHSPDRADAQRIIGMALSLGPLTVLLNDGLSEEEAGLTALREAANRALGDREAEIFIGYRIRLGIT